MALGCGATILAPVTKAMTSRSLLEIEPTGLVKETSAAWIEGGKGAHQIIGAGGGCKAELVGIQKPPMPTLEASVAPLKVDAAGTNCESRTGWLAISLAMANQS